MNDALGVRRIKSVGNLNPEIVSTCSISMGRPPIWCFRVSPSSSSMSEKVPALVFVNFVEACRYWDDSERKRLGPHAESARELAASRARSSGKNFSAT